MLRFTCTREVPPTTPRDDRALTNPWPDSPQASRPCCRALARPNRCCRGVLRARDRRRAGAPGSAPREGARDERLDDSSVDPDTNAVKKLRPLLPKNVKVCLDSPWNG